MKVGIMSYGVYIPRYRIKLEDIAAVWGADAASIKKGLKVNEKSVPGLDEDAITIAVEAARSAVRRGNIDTSGVGAIYTGSESHPYAVKPTSTIVAAAIGAEPVLTAADYEFACKAGTAAIQTCMGMVVAGMIDIGVAIGADVSQGAPGDALEYTAAAGGAAYVIGSSDLAAIIEDTYSFTTDTPDFWRREGMLYPEHGGRFTGDPGYFKHVTSAAKGLMEKIDSKPSDYDYAVFHQPNGKFPQMAGKKLGFTKEQVLERWGEPKDINKIIDTKINYPHEVINGYCLLDIDEDPNNVNIPKVIFTEDKRMIYMSRLALPGFKEDKNVPKSYYKQVCIYAFSQQELLKFGDFGRKSTIEQFEDIEILRFLEWGQAVRMVETSPGSLAVDVLSDVKDVELALTFK